MKIDAISSSATKSCAVRRVLAELRRCAITPICALTAAGAALAQTPLTAWQGAIFRPSTGQWSATPNALGTLDLHTQDPTAPGGVDVLLPPVTPGATPTVQVDLAQLDPTGALLPPGAELVFRSYGTVGGVPDQPIGSLTLTKQPGGRVEYAYDFSPVGATTYTVELWNGLSLEHVETNVPGGPGIGPLLLPNCDAHPWCCWTGQVYYSGGHWHNTWYCAVPIDWMGQIYSTNRVIVTPENPTLPVGDLTRCSIEARYVPSIELTQLTLSGYSPIGTSYCAANPNSTGLPGVIAALGSASAAANDLTLYATQLPHNSYGYFVVSPAQAFVPNAGGSQGNLCIGASTGRFIAQLGNTGSLGYLHVQVDTQSLPQPNGSVVVQPGETWNFQCWHRDANPTATSNFTAGYAVTFN